MTINYSAVIDNTIFDLKRVLVAAYEDNGISTELIDGIYDFIRSNGGNITYFTFNDREKSMIFKIEPINNDRLFIINSISNWFAMFVLNMIRNISLSYILSRSTIYYDKIRLLQDYNILALARNCISILDISTNDEFILKICLID